MPAAPVPPPVPLVSVALSDLLLSSELQDAYSAAWDEWESTGDAALWENTASDAAL
jgi:hypothetical protein